MKPIVCYALIFWVVVQNIFGQANFIETSTGSTTYLVEAAHGVSIADYDNDGDDDQDLDIYLVVDGALLTL